MRRFSRLPLLSAGPVMRPVRGLGLAALLSLAALPAPAQDTAQDPAQDTPEISLSALTEAAQAGDLQAQLILAQAYDLGGDLLQNFNRAARWYRAAAEQGDARAQNRLGQFYAAGRGISADPEAAQNWLSAAAAQGAPQHIHDLAVFLESHSASTTEETALLREAATLYKQAAEAGLLEAQVALALLLQEGRGVAQDLDLARQLYEGAAEQGHPRALNNLGLLYTRGSGVTQDYARAASLFQAAADQGLGAAMRNLSVLYENGFGVPLNEDYAAELARQSSYASLGSGPGNSTGPVSLEAVAMFYDPRLLPLPPDTSTGPLRRRAEAGDPLAQFQLGYLLSQQARPGADADADLTLEREAAYWYARAAARGYAPAMANLGLAHVQGRGVIQDYLQGRVWLALAQAAGVEATAPLLQALEQIMPPAQVRAAQEAAEARWLAQRQDTGRASQ